MSKPHRVTCKCEPCQYEVYRLNRRPLNSAVYAVMAFAMLMVLFGTVWVLMDIVDLVVESLL